jgi:hypothetical protein
MEFDFDFDFGALSRKKVSDQFREGGRLVIDDCGGSDGAFSRWLPMGGVKRCKLIRKELNLSRARHGDLVDTLIDRIFILILLLVVIISESSIKVHHERLKRGKSRGGDKRYQRR